MNSKFEKLSLQWRVTIMTVIILICCVAIFSFFTIVIAKNSFKPVSFDRQKLFSANASYELKHH